MSETPTPHLDPTPDEAPGGADAIERDPDDFPLVTPDQPRSAQVEAGDLPEEIQEQIQTVDEGTQEGSESDPAASPDPGTDTPA